MSKRGASSPLQDQGQEAKRPNVEMNQETLKQLLEANSEKDFEKNKAVLDGLDKKITEKFAALGRDIKGIKDEVKNLTQRVDITEKAIHNIENNAISRDELNEMQRKKAEIIIFDLPESKDGLKSAVMAKLNEVTPTSMEEIKFVRKFGKTSDKNRPTVVGLRSTAKREVILEGAYKVSYCIEPSLTKNQQMYKKKLKDEVQAKNSEAGGRVYKIAGPSDAPVIVTIKKNQD